jgi:predicted nucleic acid-binding protein
VIVVDASALVETLLGTPEGRSIEARLFAPGELLQAPHLIDVEAAQVIRRYAAAGKLSDTRGRELIDDLADFPVLRFPHADLLPRIWELRNNLTTYDAAYVALAEVFEAPLLTRDRRIAAAPGHHAKVELV